MNEHTYLISANAMAVITLNGISKILKAIKKDKPAELSICYDKIVHSLGEEIKKYYNERRIFELICF